MTRFYATISPYKSHTKTIAVLYSNIYTCGRNVCPGNLLPLSATSDPLNKAGPGYSVTEVELLTEPASWCLITL